MKEDEAHHRASAGPLAACRPAPVRGAMRAMSKIMTTTAYWI